MKLRQLSEKVEVSSLHTVYTPTPEEIADKHDVELEFIERQLEKGIEIEKEHTTVKKDAREIALDHLNEDPKYYIKLQKVESDEISESFLLYEGYSPVVDALMQLPDGVEDDGDLESGYPFEISEGGIGWLFPDGEAWEVGGETHEQYARERGLSMDEVYAAGVARIYATVGDMLGIEIRVKPTRQQMYALMKGAKNSHFDRFVLDGVVDESYDGFVTPGVIRNLMMNKFGMNRVTEADSPDKFRSWFGDSKVVDETGNPLVVYHGTAEKFDRFSHKYRGGMGGQLGFWFASKSDATDSFSRIVRNPHTGPNVVPVYLSIKNPKIFDGFKAYHDVLTGIKTPDQYDLDQKAKKLRTHLKRKGYDGVLIRNSDTDGGVVRDDWIAFEPNQIKSAFNKGEWSGDSDHLSEGKRETINGVDIVINPSKPEIVSILQKNDIRGILFDKMVVVWDAYDSTHYDMGDALDMYGFGAKHETNFIMSNSEDLSAFDFWAGQPFEYGGIYWMTQDHTDGLYNPYFERMIGTRGKPANKIIEDASFMHPSFIDKGDGTYVYRMKDGQPIRLQADFEAREAIVAGIRGDQDPEVVKHAMRFLHIFFDKVTVKSPKGDPKLWIDLEQDGLVDALIENQLNKQNVVKDANGKPLKVYHGSTVANLRNFDMSKVGTGVVRSNRSGGIFFTSSWDNAAYYTDPDEIIGGQYELDPDHIMIYGDDPNHYVLLESDDFEWHANFGPFVSEEEAEEAALEALNINNELHEKGQTGVIYKTTVEDHIVTAYLVMNNPLISEGGDISKLTMQAKNDGYDGLIVKDIIDGQYRSDVFVVFDPDQIIFANQINERYTRQKYAKVLYGN